MRGELLQHVGVGGGSGLGLLEDRQLKLVEEQHRQLLRRIEVQVRRRLLRDLPLERREFCVNSGAQPAEQLPVDRDAGPLHVGQHRDQRQFDLGEKPVSLS